MKILEKSRTWELAQICAKALKEKGVDEEKIPQIPQSEMVELTGCEEVEELPDKFRRFDGKDYEEGDTYAYFIALVRFMYVANV